MSRIRLLPENIISDLVVSIGRDIQQLKLTQALSSSGLVFYESSSDRQWDFDDNVTVTGGQQVAHNIAFTVIATASRPDSVLLADLIIDTVVVSGETIHRIDILPVRSGSGNTSKWHVFVYPRARGVVDAKLKCTVVSNDRPSILVIEGRR